MDLIGNEWLLLHFLCGAFVCSLGQVRVTYGPWIGPLLSSIDGSTLVANKITGRAKVPLMCAADYPTEWVGNFEMTGGPNEGDLRRHEWTDRKFNGTVEAPPYAFTAWLDLNFEELRSESSFLCRSVANHSDNILVQLRPTWDKVRVTLHPSHLPQSLEWGQGGTNTSECTLTFVVAQVDAGYYWACQHKDNSFGLMRFYNCRTASYCANQFRTAKAFPSCLVQLRNRTFADLADSPTWRPILRFGNPILQPGVAVCTINGRTAAVEYFFVGQQRPDGHHREIRFSQSETQMRDSIWMDPDISQEVHYRGPYRVAEADRSRCIVPQYGFSFDPILILLVNGTRRFLKKDFEETRVGGQEVWSREVWFFLGVYGPGTYEIQCIAPVWNTSEWANLTRTVLVRDVIRPHFITSKTQIREDVILGRSPNPTTLICDAVGDPIPKETWTWSWALATAPSSSVAVSIHEDNLIIHALPRAADAFREFQSEDVHMYVNCTASNQFRQNATKTFLLRFTPAEASETRAPKIWIWVVAGSTLLILGLMALIVYIIRKRK